MTTKDEKKEEQESFEQVERPFEVVRATGIDLSPFIVPRVFAEIEAREKAKAARRGRLWRMFAIGVPVAAMALTAVVLLPRRAFNGQVGQEMVVLLQGTGAEHKQVSFVKVDLPEGVQFYADGVPELAHEQSITLPWTPSGDKQAVPVVIRANESGLKALKVHYLDSQDHEVANRDIRIRFKSSQEQRI